MELLIEITSFLTNFPLFDDLQSMTKFQTQNSNVLNMNNSMNNYAVLVKMICNNNQQASIITETIKYQSR